MSNERNNDNYGNSHGGQHEQRANKGNSSWDDEGRDAAGSNRGEQWEDGQQQQQGMGSRGNTMNNASMGNDENYSSEQRNVSASDNDDFNNQGWEENSDDNQKSTLGAQSLTFNEDEESYREEQRTGGRSAGNNGTDNNNWDAIDQTQRTNGIHDDEQYNASREGTGEDEEV